MGIFGCHIWINFVTCEQGFRITTNTETRIKVSVIVTKMLENILESQRTIQILELLFRKKIEPYIQSIS